MALDHPMISQCGIGIAASGDDGSYVEDKFYILWDVAITWTLTFTVNSFHTDISFLVEAFLKAANQLILVST